MSVRVFTLLTSEQRISTTSPDLNLAFTSADFSEPADPDVQPFWQDLYNAGADVVLDMVGGSYIEKNVDVLALEGRLSIVATQGGRTGQLDVGKQRPVAAQSAPRAQRVGEARFHVGTMADRAAR